MKSPIAHPLTDHKAVLGEGIAWHPQRQSLMWVDIATDQIFEKQVYQDNTGVRGHKLSVKPTALIPARDDTGKVWVVCDKGLGLFSLDTGEFQLVKKVDIPGDFRTNDAGISADGRLWFGTMQRQPREPAGSIYSINPSGELHLEYQGIAIPNTFASGATGEMLISDSFRQKTYKCPTESGTISLSSTGVFLDLSHTPATPDGGVCDDKGNLWIALWDGFSIRCYSPQGALLYEVRLPVPRPTNCCFGGTDMDTLYITTARDGLTEEQLANYPLSGATFFCKPGAKGLRPATFNMV